MKHCEVLLIKAIYMEHLFRYSGWEKAVSSQSRLILRSEILLELQHFNSSCAFYLSCGMTAFVQVFFCIRLQSAHFGVVVEKLPVIVQISYVIRSRDPEYMEYYPPTH